MAIVQGATPSKGGKKLSIVLMRCFFGACWVNRKWVYLFPLVNRERLTYSSINVKFSMFPVEVLKASPQNIWIISDLFTGVNLQTFSVIFLRLCFFIVIFSASHEAPLCVNDIDVRRGVPWSHDFVQVCGPPWRASPRRGQRVEITSKIRHKLVTVETVLHRRHLVWIGEKACEFWGNKTFLVTWILNLIKYPTVTCWVLFSFHFWVKRLICP